MRLALSPSLTCRGIVRLAKQQDTFLRQITLPPEPILHRRFQFLDRNMSSDFHHPIGNGKGVVKHGGVGEIAHGKTVQPLQRTGQAPSVIFVFHANPAGKHQSNLTTDFRPTTIHVGTAAPAVRLSAARREFCRNRVAEPCSAGQPGAAVPTWSGAALLVRAEARLRRLV
jgi:hypothetical protein